MREIKFRGKRMATGKWIYGGYASSKGQTFIIDDEGNAKTVHADTIGQYTGLKDRNGKEIYEGDIIKMSHPDKRRLITKEVYWREDCAAWYVRNEYYNEPLVLSLRDSDEVIGNIHDGPKLIGYDIAEYVTESM